MNGLIASNYAELVPEEEMKLDNGRIWYLPHHGVYRHRKLDKIRVVFDCSAVYKGQSINQNLLQGPDLTNSLLGVLCRFRENNIALMCDLEAMFHQAMVNVDDRNFLRFLWWKNGLLDNEPNVYCVMTAHLFAATSSPGRANIGLKMAADDYERECGSQAANFVRDNFYVDDGLKSVSTPTNAIDLIQKPKTLCKKGGIRLHKIISNSKEVIEAIPLEERAKGIQDLDPTRDSLPIERALGVQWCVESDTLKFRIELADRPSTRRGILSTVSSVFDLLRVLAPFVLNGKRILKELCREGVNWDDKIPDALLSRWERWRNVVLLAKLSIPRCYVPVDFGEIKIVELHNFSDASENGYGQCSNLRLIDHLGRIYCLLVLAKSRAAPLKHVTIPRLELTAALVSARVGVLLKTELEYEQINEFFWPDSKIVLGYISKSGRRCHVFVANRIQQIRDLTALVQWRYVESKDNPADYASRIYICLPLYIPRT